MIVHTQNQELAQQLSEWQGQGNSVGFVPTMGALHRGHASLCTTARSTTGRVVVSIFVNPSQFTDAQDLEKYPRTIDQDLDTLSSLGVDAVYLPDADDVYPAGYTQPVYELGTLEQVMEGLHRPGHFQGVAAVLDRFFQMLPMDVAFFGEKDFQQLAVVRKLVELKGYELTVMACPTMREECGLAMCSRNTRLSLQGRQKACMIHQGLLDIKEQTADVFEAELVVQTIKKWTAFGMDVEYLELANDSTFQAAQAGDGLSLDDPWRLFAAVHLDGVRLIDNLALKS